MQIQSPFFTKLPGEIHLIVYGHILSDFRGKNRRLFGALSSCKQMKGEMEKELTQAFLRNLTATINQVQVEWNIRLPPFRVTHTPYTKDLKYDAITLDIALLYPTVQSVTGKHCLEVSVLPYLTEFHLKDVNFSFFHSNAVLSDTLEPNRPSGPASSRPFISLAQGAAPRRIFPWGPRAQKVTLIIEPGLDQFETVYRLWYRVWCHHLDGKGYDKKLEDKGGPKILMVHSRKKA